MQSLSPSSPSKVVGGKVQCAFEHYLAVVAYFARDINSNTIGINVCATENSTGNVHDTKPVEELAKGLTDKLYGDKGYLSNALKDNLFDKGVTLITTVRKNMKAKAMSLWDRAMLSKRFIIETINDQLKNISFIEHSRHRSINGFTLNLMAGLVAYCLKENKPSLNLTDVERNSMVMA